MDRRRFLGGAAMLGAAAVMGPAGIAALRSAGARSAAPPVLPAPRYRTVVETRHTPAGVPYLAAVARPI